MDDIEQISRETDPEHTQVRLDVAMRALDAAFPSSAPHTEASTSVEQITDLIADLAHLADACYDDGNGYYALSSAERHFALERDNDDEEDG